MTRTKSTILALITVLLSPMVANADLLSYDFFDDSGAWTFDASFIIDEDDLVVGDIISLFDSWSASWTDGVEFYELSSATSSRLAGSTFNVGPDGIPVPLVSLCSDPCSVGFVAFDLLVFSAGLFEWDATFGRDLLSVASGGGEVTRPNPVSVPEPGTLALFGIGLLGMGLARRNKKA